jgi:hypothetical protein
MADASEDQAMLSGTGTITSLSGVDTFKEGMAMGGCLS